MNYYLLVATISLVFQLAVLVLLVAGFQLKKRFRFRLHGFTMLVALVMHIVAVGAIMIPAFVISLIPKTLEEPLSLVGILSPLHAALGSITIIIAGLIIGSWRFRKSTKFCAPKRKLMRAAFILWLVSLSIGILFYLVLNWSFFFVGG